MTKREKYLNAKCTILTQFTENAISAAEKDELLNILEAKKEAGEVDLDKVKDMFKKIKEGCPDLKDDVDDLFDKIEAACEGKEDGGDGDEGGEDEVTESEMFKTLSDDIDAIFG